jgi:AAHS family 4-hydroxybenzoate transporter-like MFS transporter
MLASLTSLVSEFFPDRMRNMAIGILLAGYPLGAMLGGFLAKAVIPAFGWQGIFVAGGIMTLCLLPLVLMYVPESLYFLMRRRPDSCLERMNAVLRYLQMPELQDVPKAGAKPEAASVRSLLTKSRRKSTLQLWSSFFLCFGTLYFLLSWIPKLLVDAGLPLGQAISAGIAFNVGGVLGNICIGWVSTRWGLQKAILYFHLIAASGMLLFAWLPLGVASMLWLAGIIGLFQQGGFVGFYMTAARLYPPEIRTTGVGWGIGLGRFGAVIAPYLAGQLIALGWGIGILFTIFAVPLAIGGWITYSIRSKDLPR